MSKRGRRQVFPSLSGWGEARNDEPLIPVKPMTPHNDPLAATEFFDWSMPKIVVSYDAYQDMQCIIQAAGSDEIGWMGTVRKEGDRYIIERIFLLEQEVSGTHCEFDHGAYGQLCLKLTDGGKTNRDLIENMLFWGHLHPGDMTEPSGQDDDMLKAFKENDFFIRGIFTRGGKCVFTFVDYRRGIKIYDCPWEAEVVDTERQKRIREEVREKVRKPYFHHFIHQSIAPHRIGERLDIKDNEAVAPPSEEKTSDPKSEGVKDLKEAAETETTQNAPAPESAKDGAAKQDGEEDKTDAATGTQTTVVEETETEIHFDGE